MSNAVSKKGNGFSIRLNLLLDKANFSPLGEGRAAEVARLGEVSRISARQWLLSDTEPRLKGKLEEICESLLHHCSPGATANDVCQWLRQGDEVANPLTDSFGIIPTQDPLLVAKVYTTVLEDASNMGVDLEGQDTIALQHFFSTLITNAHKNKVIDRQLITHLLSLMN